MRKVILVMQITLDGFVAGENDELDWLVDEEDQWKDLFEILKSADTFLLGRVMYPGYANYWRGVLANPAAKKNETKFARIAEKTRHIVFSRTMKKADWKNTMVERGDVSEAAEQENNPIKRDISRAFLPFPWAEVRVLCLSLLGSLC